MSSPFLKKSIVQNEKQVADNKHKIAVSTRFIVINDDGDAVLIMLEHS